MKKNYLSKLLAITFSIMLFHLTFNINSGYVKSSENNMGNTLYVGGTGPGNYSTISEAIACSSAGDTIFVYRGTYYENRLKISVPLRLIGEDKNSTIIDGRKMGDILGVFSDDVEIMGFTFYNGSQIPYTLDNAIWMEYSSDCIISDNIFMDVFTGIVDVESSGNLICDNIFVNNTFGVRIAVASTIIRGNYFYNHNFGIDVQYCKTTIEENIIYKGSTPYNSWGICMKFSSVSINDNIISDFIYGITLDALSSFNTIKNNEILNNRHGIEVYGGSMFNRIINNNISNSWEFGLCFTFSNFNVIKRNNFIDNNNDALLSFAFGNRWSRNYWDDWNSFGPMIIWCNNSYLPWFNIDFRPVNQPYYIGGN